MDQIKKIQGWLKKTNIDGIVIPSTDEFLNEFAPPANRRLEWLTGFRGSTGVALILQGASALFVDGRYNLQAEVDVKNPDVAIQPSSDVDRSSWLHPRLKPGARIGVDPWLHSTSEMGRWRKIAADLGAEIVSIEDNPVDIFWSNGRPAQFLPQLDNYPEVYAGDSSDKKCLRIAEHLRRSETKALLVANPEDVSWLLNVRADAQAIKSPVGEWHIVPTCLSRAIICNDGQVLWFVDRTRLSDEIFKRCVGRIEIRHPSEIKVTISELLQAGPVAADLDHTPAAIGESTSYLRPISSDDVVARERWRKKPAEVLAATKVHIMDAVAVVRFMAWLSQRIIDHDISELEAAEALEAFRSERPEYKGPSMPFMSASGANGAKPHYVPSPSFLLDGNRQNNRYLNDHPIYWMDSGGQYFGGTTDNTITMALGTPEPEHVLAHTLVVQGLIALSRAKFPIGTYGARLDAIARYPLWQEGMDYDHGTGHGVGNFLNIHEGPMISRWNASMTTAPLEVGMIITNEPGYYLAGEFGLRVETHMVVVNSDMAQFLAFDTISRLPIDPSLMDFSRLSEDEKRWLQVYHQAVLSDLCPLLEPGTAAWLRQFVQPYFN